MMSPSFNSVPLSLRATRPFTGHLKQVGQAASRCIPTSTLTTARGKVASTFAAVSGERSVALRQSPMAMLMEIILSQTLAVIVAGLVVAAVLH